MDIKPGDYPNVLEIKKDKKHHHKKKKKEHEKGGVLPVAVLGQADFDPGDVDISSVRLEGAVPVGEKMRLEDVGSPSGGESCPFTSSDRDGFEDLILKFRKKDIASIVSSDDDLPEGSEIELKLTGALIDGTPFEAFDCVVIHDKKHKKDDDVTGRLVRVLQSGTRPAGVNTVSWDGSKLASGIYFLRLETGGKTIARKLVVVK
jgi:hypothetical protein